MAEIQVYTTPSCHYCTKLKKWLKKNQIEYIEHDISEDKEKAQEIIKKTGQRGVPQTLIKTDDGEKAIVGFQPREIKNLTE